MQSRIKFYYILLSLISPVLALITAIRSNNQKYILYAGTIFMGFVGSVYIYLTENDGYTHLMRAYDFYFDMSFFQFLDGFWKLLTFQPIKSSNDLFIHIISYLAAGVFKFPELIHVFAGLLLGYYFTKSVLLVLEDKLVLGSAPIILGFLCLFLISNSISALNAIRMWPAMWVFFYGALGLIKKRKIIYIWPIILSMFIHFSYLLYIIPLLFSIILRNRRIIVVIIFFASNFINLDFKQSSSLINETGLYEEKANLVVLDDDDLERITEEKKSVAAENFYKAFGKTLFQQFSTVLLSFALVIIYLSKVRVDYIDFLIASGLLILSLSNLAKLSTPAVYGRGYEIASTFLIAASLIVLNRGNLFLKPGIKSGLIYFLFTVFLFSCIPYVLFQISYVFNTVSVFVFFIPVISWFFGNTDISIRDFLIFDF